MATFVRHISLEPLLDIGIRAHLDPLAIPQLVNIWARYGPRYEATYIVIAGMGWVHLLGQRDPHKHQPPYHACIHTRRLRHRLMCTSVAMYMRADTRAKQQMVPRVAQVMALSNLKTQSHV